MTSERVILTPDSESSLATLRRALSRSRGVFSFHLVICNGAARSEVIVRLAAWSGTGVVPTLVSIPVGRAGSEELQRRLAEIGVEQPLSGLVVIDGDTLILDEATRTALNVVRDRLAQLVKGPFVLLVSPHGARELQELAPDLFDVRSGTYRAEAVTPEFEANPSSLLETESQLARPVTSAADLERLEAAEEPPPPAALADAWLNLAVYLKSEGRLKDAAIAAQQTIRIANTTPEAPYVGAKIDALGVLAQIAFAEARTEAAEQYLSEAIELANGSEHPSVTPRLHSLALMLYSMNRLTEAEPLVRRALAMDESSFGPDHPRVVAGLNNLAVLLRNSNRMSEAEPLMRRALAMDESSFGPDHPKVAIRLNNLAQLLQETGRMSEAEPLMRRALAINESSFGPDHPDVATAQHNLAALLKDTNRMSEAEPLMRRALAIDENSLGPNHPKVATRLNNLGQLFQATGRLSEAEPLMRRALAVDENSMGPNHPNVAIRLNNLAALLQHTNRVSEAEPLMRRALSILEASLGVDHPRACTVRKNLETLLAARTKDA